jgi:RsiW-degrading membrane proteinase PrsW (M82 family)
MNDGPPRDPIQRAADPDDDLYDIVQWDVRSTLDRFSVAVYRSLIATGRRAVILLGFLIILSQIGLVATVVERDPATAVYIGLSVVPALALALYVRRQDVGAEEPLVLLVGTFVLGVVFAGFAAVLNSVLIGYFEAFGIVGLIAFFYIVVAPVEETVKWLAIRLYGFRSPEFTTVVDGAVYGAMAGLGFATIENALYISQEVLAIGAASPSLGTLSITAVRSLAGPGHIIYSAFAGYYLGLAKFNPENAGPIVVKGLIIAALLHGTYNVLVTLLPTLVSISGLAVGTGIAFVGLVIVYDGVALLALVVKLRRYRSAFDATGAVDPREGESNPK